MDPKINYLNLRSKVTWRPWLYITHSLLVAHIYTKYHKYMSKDIKGYIPDMKMHPEINLALRSMATWRSWWYIAHCLIVAQLHTKYHKSMSKDKEKVTSLSVWHENAPINWFDIEINDHMKVVMLPYPPSDSSTPSSQIW